MKCPACDETLVMADRQGVEIDYCPRCRGVWLDRGELDKIIERSQQHESRDIPPRDFRHEDDDERRRHSQQPYKKKKGFLGDFFDFD